MSSKVENFQEKAVRLFTFLKELMELSSKTVRSLEQYENVLWISGIPKEQGCYCAFWETDYGDGEPPDVWLEVHKPNRIPPPPLPKKLQLWINESDLNNSSLDFPELRTKITITESQNETGRNKFGSYVRVEHIEDHPEIEKIWEKYCEEKWIPWAIKDQQLKAVQKIYTELFSIYQKQQKLGEQYEVIIGLGLLSWRTQDGQEIQRHLLTAQTSISFEAERGVISIGPSAEGAKLRLEQEMIDPQYRPNPEVINRINKECEEIGDNLADFDKIASILKRWVNSVSSNGTFEDTLIARKTVSTNPIVSFAPALILRKRTERSFVQIFSNIIELLESHAPLPPGVMRLITNADETLDAWLENDHVHTSETVNDNTIYFPLEANEEQLKIIERFRNHQGVLVQGPPGTGKSHTIVNLIAHLLATGKRILVTSHTARALAVLKNFIKEKIPEMAPLAVVLLGNNRDALQEMENSIQGITSRYANWNAEKNRQKIRMLEAQLEKANRDEAQFIKEMFAIRERETYKYSRMFGNYKGTAQQIAIRVQSEKPRFAWFKDQPTVEAEPPLTVEQLHNLFHLLNNTELTEIERLNFSVLSPQDLPTPEEFQSLIDDEKKVSLQFQNYKAFLLHPGYSTLKNLNSDVRTKLKQHTRKLVQTYDFFLKHHHSWVRQAAQELLAGQKKHWELLVEITEKHLTNIEDKILQTDKTEITGLKRNSLQKIKTDALILLHHLEDGGKLGFWIFRPKAIRDQFYLTKTVTVNGHFCKNTDTLKELINWIDVHENLNVVRNQWKPYANVSETLSATLQFANFKDNTTLLKNAFKLIEHKNKLQQIIAEIDNCPEPVWHEINSLKELETLLECVEIEKQLSKVSSAIDNVERFLERFIGSHYTNVHPVIPQLRKAVRDRSILSYEQGYSELTKHHQKLQLLDEKNRLFEKLTKYAPNFARSLKDNPNAPDWETKINDFVHAWNWARAQKWLQNLKNNEYEEQLKIKLDETRKQIRRLLGEIAAAKAWEFTFSNMKENQRRYLVAWSKEVRLIGKAKGKYASLHRRLAQTYMNECKEAIPVWIMPLYRVAETISPTGELFDVAIIDEASQSGPEAILLFYLAKQIIVVGDDQQITPQFIGINHMDVKHLIRTHLDDFPLADAFGIDHSFFALAEIYFGGRIRLREHFRCMPEIIQFSNHLCYQSEPLIPLRQYGADRLEPVIVTRHIPHGYTKGQRNNIINPPEAEAIVQEILRCVQDPAYKDKSMGVISLQGSKQASYIEKLLLEKLGPEEMEKRQIVCGDAYAFQGDERDIIFLSMVAAPSEDRRIGVLASDRDKRRFNVAASRARDQMWLFHSATLNDLSPRDMRYKLLEYCLNPYANNVVVSGSDLKIEELSYLARKPNRSAIPPPYPFESWFEVDVFLQIINRGYKVIPQYEIAGYRIDLVIEGLKSRLAVECDGDEWHGIDRYNEDMARQRMLERCGWTFWRIRGSIYYTDPDTAMESLWETLERLKIFPMKKQKEQKTEKKEFQKREEVPRDTTILNETQNPYFATSQTDLTEKVQLEEKETNSLVQDHFTVLQNAPETDSKKTLEKLENFPDTPATWFALAKWAKENHHFTPNARRFIFKVGFYLSRGWNLSNKMENWAEKLWQKAVKMGFKMPE